TGGGHALQTGAGPQRVEIDRWEFLHQIEGEGDVLGTERLTVVPLHALADREHDRLLARTPLVRRRKHRRLLRVVHDVDKDERLVDEAERFGVHRRIERIELARPGLPLDVGDRDGPALLVRTALRRSPGRGTASGGPLRRRARARGYSEGKDDGD